MFSLSIFKLWKVVMVWANIKNRTRALHKKFHAIFNHLNKLTDGCCNTSEVLAGGDPLHLT